MATELEILELFKKHKYKQNYNCSLCGNFHFYNILRKGDNRELESFIDYLERQRDYENTLLKLCLESGKVYYPRDIDYYEGRIEAIDDHSNLVCYQRDS